MDPDQTPAESATGLTPSPPWWRQRTPSVLTLVALLVVLGVATLLVARSVAEVLPDIGSDHLGEDSWDDPLGLYVPAGFQVARVPDCAAGSFTRIVLWDADSNPFWEVSGPPTALSQFVVGAEPEGFTTTVDYQDPPADAVLRLVAFRRNGGPVGLRFTADDLSDTRVVSGSPLRRFTVSGFQSADVCDDDGDPVDDDGIVRPDLSRPTSPLDLDTTDDDPLTDEPETDGGPIDDGGELDEDQEDLDYEDLIDEAPAD